MYPSVEKTIALTQKYKDRPMILCEYSHSMSNSNGNIHLYWEAFRSNKFPRLAGGFIWDMIDQGLRKVEKETGREYFGYGGDFGDKINDRQFCINGLFSPDRQAHPAVAEVKYLQQPISIEASRRHAKNIYVSSDYMIELRMKNRFSFRPLDCCEWKWFLTSDTKVGVVHASVLQQVPSDGLIQIKLTEGKSLLGNSRLWLNIQCYFIGNQEILAKEQFELLGEFEEDSGYEIISTSSNDAERRALEVKKKTDCTEVWSLDRSGKHPMVKIVTIDHSSGQISSFATLDGFEALNNATPNFTRAVVDNDRGGTDLHFIMLPIWVSLKMKLCRMVLTGYSYWYEWKKHGLCPLDPPKIICQALNVEGGADFVRIDANCDVISSTKKRLFSQKLIYTIYPDSAVQVNVTTTPLKCLENLETLPRLGFTMSIHKSLKNIIYLGRGPGENYCDRKSSSDFGVWQTSPSGMAFDYIVPCENGNVTDCSWVTFTNEEGNGILLVDAKGGRQPTCEGFQFSALLHNQRELHMATHTHLLEERRDGESPIFVNLDHYQAGVGGDVSWLPCVYPEYRLKPTNEFKSR